MKRSWSLEAARALLPDVRERTRAAVEAVEAITLPPAGAAGHAELERRTRDRISLWAREMDALGLEVKGLWLVDFDNGQGYYCWRWPEERLEWFHGYDDGFAGRVRIQ